MGMAKANAGVVTAMVIFPARDAGQEEPLKNGVLAEHMTKHAMYAAGRVKGLHVRDVMAQGDTALVAVVEVKERLQKTVLIAIEQAKLFAPAVIVQENVPIVMGQAC